MAVIQLIDLKVIVVIVCYLVLFVPMQVSGSTIIINIHILFNPHLVAPLLFSEVLTTFIRSTDHLAT